MSRKVNVVAAAVGGPWPSGARVLYDWGDRSEPSEGQGGTKAASHTYAVEGTFRIRGQVFTRDLARIGGPAFASYDTTPVFRIHSITPPGGPPEGGTPCVIDGQQLTGSTAVFFGSNQATNMQVLSNASISCNSPPGTPEAMVNVNVMRGTASNPIQYKYGAASDEGEAEE
jgi:hypothetical protein